MKKKKKPAIPTLLYIKCGFPGSSLHVLVNAMAATFVWDQMSLNGRKSVRVRGLESVKISINLRVYLIWRKPSIFMSGMP